MALEKETMRISTETKVGIFVLSALGIFLYMTFQIGAFRVDTGNYKTHSIFFKDVSGLARKADVKIAGVKVGWVDDISLIQGDVQFEAEATILIDKRYSLRTDAIGIVRQDGLLGVKFLEINPGDPLLPILQKGQPLDNPGKAPASIDSLIQKFSNVADNVQEITLSLKEAVAGAKREGQLRDIVDRFHSASERMSSFAEGLDRIVGNNEHDINSLVSDLRNFAHDLRTGYPMIQDDIHRLAEQLNTEVLPGFQENVDKIARAFDKDFGNVTNKIEATASAIEEAAYQTRDGFKSIGAVADKINEGKGLVGKLINEDETYQDLKVAVQGLKNYVSRMESVGVVFDTHFESMYRPAEHFQHKDAKGYVDMRIHPAEDRFYLVQLCGCMKGRIQRKEVRREWYDQNGILYDQDNMLIDDNFKLFFSPNYLELTQVRDVVKYGFQFGKIYNDIAFRAGLFESSFGLGIDYELPLGNDAFRWVTTFEGFDFRGRDRVDDARPHLKWLNRVFLLRNFYINCGADDFISKKNANVFYGFGMRFVDDDIKYFISKLGLTNMSGAQF